MNRYTFAGLVFVLTTVMIVPFAQAETASNAIRRNTRKLTPFTLVSLAYQGHYRSQGVRGYGGLFVDSHDGRISAEQLVQAAVNARDLPPETLNDQGFINAVEANLDALEIPNSP